MKKLMVLVLLSGCSSTQPVAFDPTTQAGASCKVQCADVQYRYVGGYERCIEGCRDVDRLSRR